MNQEIRQAAEALGELLLNSEAFTQMQAAEEAALQDETLQAEYREYSLLRTQLQEELSQDAPDQEQVAAISADIERVQGLIQQMDSMERLNAARADFNDLMNEVNLTLQGILAPQDEDEMGGCPSSGCAGCSGCGPER